MIYDIDPCTLSVFDDFTVPDMEAYILGGKVVLAFDEVSDSESKASGDFSGTTFCGPRFYSLVEDIGKFFTLEVTAREFTLVSTDKADIS